MSSPHPLHFSEKAEGPAGPFSLLPPAPVSLPPGWPSSEPPEIDPPMAGVLAFTSPLLPSLNLGLSHAGSAGPPLSLPEEEHLESFMAPQMSSGEGVPACPLLLHMPPVLQSSHLPRLLTDQVKSVSCFFRLQLPPNPSASAPLFHSLPQRWHLRLPLSPCA